MKQKVMLVDGMALLFRAFYATAVYGSFMVNSKGIPTNAVYGFVKHLLTAIKKFEPTHVICCWDMGSTTFRNELFSDYKANRKEPPSELIPQFDLAKEVVDAFNIPNVGFEGFEADDCIGTLAKKYHTHADVLILTGDQDILQLIDDRITVILLKKGMGNYEVYDLKTLMEEKGLTPQQIVDLKALMGDPSDNYPGVKGIGIKTAIKLLQQYGSIDEILQNLDALSKAQREKIHQNLSMLHLSRKLASIHCEVPLSLSLDEAKLNIQREQVMEKFADLEWKGFDRLIQ
jgi:5'-3' exonuclease